MVTHATPTTYEIKNGDWDQTVSYNKSITWNGKAWTLTINNESATHSRQGTTYIYFGAKTSGKNFTELTFTSSAFSGVITNVKVDAKVSGTEAQLTPKVTVGGTEFTSTSTGTLGTTRSARSFSGSASGNIVIEFSGDSKTKQLQVYAISVTYDPDATVGGDKPAAPDFFDSNYDEITTDSYTFTDPAGGEIYADVARDASPSYTVTPDDAATVDLTSNTYTFTVTKSCAITVSATNASGTTSKTLTVIVPDKTTAAPKFYDSTPNEITTGSYTFTDPAGGEIMISDYDEGATITYVVTPSDAATFDNDIFTVTKSCTISVTATKGTATATSTLSVTVPKEISGNTFELVTSTDDIVIGAEYVIVTGTTSLYGMSPTPLSAEGTISTVPNAITDNNDNTIEVDTDKVAVLTLVKGKTNYALQYPSGEYLSASSSANDKSFNSTANTDDAAADLTITPTNTKYPIKFTNPSRYIRANGTKDFRTYTLNSTGAAVYLYKRSAPKTAVTLSWDQSEYTANTAFGWESSEPVLTITPADLNLTAGGLGITYDSSAKSVATVSADADGNLVVTPVSTGNSTISAVVPNSNAEYKSNTATFTLHVTAAPKVIYANADGTDFEENQVVLLPSQIKAGYTFLIKAPEGYTLGDVNSDQVNNTTITFNDDRTVATIVVTKACVISAKVKKGEQQASRGTTFTVSEKALGDANINWSAEFYAYDLATGLWKVSR